MPVNPTLASTAFLMADPARAAMLMALVGGQALPAGELAYVAGITAQTASSHLAKLLGGGLLAVETQGRHRLFRLASPEVAIALESLAAITPVRDIRSLAPGRHARDLGFARCCYDHLAGQLGVAMTQALQARGVIEPAPDQQFLITASGQAWLAELGLDVTQVKASRRGLARQCLDWTEREHHLAGPLGVQLLNLLCARGWLRRVKASRAIQVTPEGWVGLKEQFGVDQQSLETPRLPAD